MVRQRYSLPLAFFDTNREDPAHFNLGTEVVRQIRGVVTGKRLARGIATAGLALVLTALLGGTSLASAATPTWLQAQPIEPSGGTIYGLSCASPTTCLAASTLPIVQDGGLSYEPATDPDPSSILSAVSCAPNTHFCMFVDGNGGAFSYNSGSFGALKDIDGSVELDAVSCPSAGFCIAIDNNPPDNSTSVFKYANGSWDSGTPLSIPSGDTYNDFVSVSCASSAFCIAVVSVETASGTEELAYTYNGSSWSSVPTPFDAGANHVDSLSCTSTTFCLATDDAGNASTFTGSGWTTKNVDSVTSTPELHSSCAGTSCVAVDFNDNFVHTTDGSTWTTPTNLHASTGISGIYSMACATATLCVAGDGLGDATTYSVPPLPGKPRLTGTATVGHTLTLTHATVQIPNVWYYDDWRRCDNPDATCTLDPISTSAHSYALGRADAGKYIDVRETIGFGFDEESQILSNIVGPISGGVPPPIKPGTATFAGGGATRKGVVTISLRCAGGPCRGKTKLTFRGQPIGSASYSISAGQTAKVKIPLNAAGKTQLRKHHGHLKATLVITPVKGTVKKVAITLTVKH
jgi:hypothetical protein